MGQEDGNKMGYQDGETRWDNKMRQQDGTTRWDNKMGQQIEYLKEMNEIGLHPFTQDRENISQ